MRAIHWGFEKRETLLPASRNARPTAKHCKNRHFGRFRPETLDPPTPGRKRAPDLIRRSAKRPRLGHRAGNPFFGFLSFLRRPAGYVQGVSEVLPTVAWISFQGVLEGLPCLFWRTTEVRSRESLRAFTVFLRRPVGSVQGVSEAFPEGHDGRFSEPYPPDRQGPGELNVFKRGRTPNWRHRNRMNLGDGPCVLNVFKRGRTPNLRHGNWNNLDDEPCVFNEFVWWTVVNVFDSVYSMPSKEVEHKDWDIGSEWIWMMDPVYSMSLKEVEHQTGDIGIECSMSPKEVEHQTGDIGIEWFWGMWMMDPVCSMSSKEVEHQTGDIGTEWIWVMTLYSQCLQKR